MTVEANKQLVRHYFEEFFNNRNYGAAQKLFDENCEVSFTNTATDVR